MSISVTGKLNKAANEFQAGESKGFGIRLGVQYYDRDTKQKEWTNYQAVIFAKASAQIDFYRSVLVEGAVVEVSAPQVKIDTYNDNHSIELLNAHLGYAFNPQGQAPQQRAPQQQQQRQQQHQQHGGPVAQAAPGGWDDFGEDKIPF